jgi:pilus assembly protein CpaB
MLPGEPVTSLKLVKAGDGGVLAAILPAGMRAISTRIKEETAAGRLILPNDRVDVILTQRRRGRGGVEDSMSDTLFATSACSPSVSSSRPRKARSWRKATRRLSK